MLTPRRLSLSSRLSSHPHTTLFAVLRARQAAELELIRRVLADPAVGVAAAAGAVFDSEDLGILWRACQGGGSRWEVVVRAAGMLADAGLWDFDRGPTWLVRLSRSLFSEDPAGACGPWLGGCVVAPAARDLLRLADGIRDASLYLRRGWGILEGLIESRAITSRANKERV